MSESEKMEDHPIRANLMKIGMCCSGLLMADILLFWYDEFLGVLITIFLFFITIPTAFLFLIAFVKSCWFESGWHKAMFGCGIGTFLLLAAYLLFRAPETRCNPDIMARNYEEHKHEMVELCDYMQSVLADSTAIELEFKWNRIERFYVSVKSGDSYTYSSFWDEEARSKRDSLMAVVGLTEEEFKGIRDRLNKVGCIGIIASRYSESTTIYFRRVGMGMYDYCLLSNALDDEEKENVLANTSVLPYNDHVLFGYGGPAFGSDNFPLRDQYLKKHKPW